MYYPLYSKNSRGGFLIMAKSNKKYKDSLIRHIFSAPEKALQLYNAVTSKNLSADTPVEMKTIKTVLTSKLRNDLSFIVDGNLAVFIEHQSTINPNMPLRLLKYVLLFFEEYCSFGEALYRENLLRLPKPEFFLLYNGKKVLKADKLKLSDSFIGLGKGEKPGLELIVNMIDISYDENKEILQKNEDLNGYAYFVSQVDHFQKKGTDLDEAINAAYETCIKKKILYEILLNLNNKELINMVKFEYNEKVALEVARKEGIEIGREEGIKIGEKNNSEKGAEELIRHMLKSGKTAEAISAFANIPLAQVIKVEEKLLVNV
jgi:hypothetical protein